MGNHGLSYADSQSQHKRKGRAYRPIHWDAIMNTTIRCAMALGKVLAGRDFILVLNRDSFTVNVPKENNSTNRLDAARWLCAGAGVAYVECDGIVYFSSC